ncbi:putative tail protein [Klebsiella phage vB_KpnS_Uniso31]|uniref:Tail protein n=1 Tax=Klebsiella phage vB_KpnS_Uniso31 TaxID=2951200 RepID=A0A9E7NGF5_9CAUD|nr:putative tail protein [Klebsiella phage vB_KpnS_Uniso31]
MTGGLYHVKRPEIGGLFYPSFINRLSEFNRRTN